jgi:hypothetical protein
MTVMAGTVSLMQRKNNSIVAGLDNAVKSLYSTPLSNFRRQGATEFFLQEHIMTTVLRLPADSTRITGRSAFACARAALLGKQTTFASKIERPSNQPWMHGYTDSHGHPGRGET